MNFKLKAMASRIVKIISIFLFAAAAVMGSVLLSPPNSLVIAVPNDQSVSAFKISKNAARDAKLDLEAVAGEGASERVEEKVQKLSGSVQGKVGKVEEAVEEAKQQTAQARNRVEPGTDSVDNTVTQQDAAAESPKSSLIDSVRGLFKG
jgi:hypothetical protein